MGQFTQFAINGLMSGAIYALIAVGIVSVYKATKVVNFAHGYLIMFGAYFFFYICRHYSRARMGA